MNQRKKEMSCNGKEFREKIETIEEINRRTLEEVIREIESETSEIWNSINRKSSNKTRIKRTSKQCKQATQEPKIQK
jgi:hypothetical protein